MTDDPEDTRPKPRRLSPQVEQEHTSRGQVEAVLRGWICNSLSKDFGEDFLIAIYDDGRSTGLTFHLQVKSISTFDRVQLATDPDNYSYELEVADLEHWEDTNPPVVVLIWNVTTQTGAWQDVPSLIKSLDEAHAAWRSQDSVRVRLPIRHTLDSAGRSALRQRIAELTIPAISNGKDFWLKPTFVFPNTDDGRTLQSALRTAIERGQEITVTRENIRRFKFPDWWERAFGAIIPDFVKIKPSTEETEVHLCLEAIGDAGFEKIHFQAKRVDGGTRFATLATASDEVVGLTMKFDREAEEIGLSMHFLHPHPDPSKTLALTRVFSILREGGSLRLLHGSGGHLGDIELDVDSLPTGSQLKAWQFLLVGLLAVRGRLDGFGLLRIPTPLTTEDFQKALRLIAIVRDAREEASLSFSTQFGADSSVLPASAEEEPPRIIFGLGMTGTFEACGVSIPLGRIEVEPLDQKAAADAFEVAVRENRTELLFEDMEARVRYLDWENGGRPSPPPSETES